MTPMMERVAGAPISWGVCEVPGWGHNLPAERVLDEMRRMGLRATELGPTGYLPEDPTEQAALLNEHDLKLVGAFLPVVLHRAELADAELVAAERAMTQLASAGAGVLVLAAATGANGYETSTSLDDAEWQQVARMIALLDGRAKAYGLQVAVHPHVGTAIANAAEVQRLLTHTNARLCLDTGHLAIGGVDVLALAKDAADRVVHVHLKDVDLAKAQRVSAGQLSYLDAVRDGLYRPLGQGDAPIADLVGVLEQSGYGGWYVLEQDVSLLGEPDDAGPMADVQASLEFLRQIASSHGF